MMDGLLQSYKQIESFGLSHQFMGDDFPDRNKFQNCDATGNFEIVHKIGINTELSYNDSSVLIGSLGGVVGKYIMGAIIRDGIIYCLPSSATAILKINTNNDTVSSFGSFGGTTYKWQSTIRWKEYVIGLPYNESRIIKVNTLNDSHEFFGNYTGGSRWYSAILASNGFIYGCPWSANAIIKVNPIDCSATLIPISGGNYTSISMLGDYLYFFPYSASRVIRLNLKDDTTALIGSALSEGQTISSSIAKNGFIYLSPFRNTSFFGKFNPGDGTIKNIAPSTGASRYIGVLNGADGYLYCTPHGVSAGSIARINTITDNVDYVADTTIKGSTNGAYYCGVLAANSKIYFIPAESPSVGVFGINRPIDPNFVLNRNFNKL